MSSALSNLGGFIFESSKVGNVRCYRIEGREEERRKRLIIGEGVGNVSDSESRRSSSNRPRL